MDLMQAAVTVGAVVATAVISRIKKSGFDEKRMETVETTQGEHAKRLNEHDNKFEELNIKFVPRQEQNETMSGMRESLRRTERMVEALVLPRVRPIGIDD